MKKLLTILLLIIAIACTAQPPGADDSIMSIKRPWKKHDPFVGVYDPQLKSTQLPMIYKRTDTIAALLREAYPQPTGTDAYGYTSVIGEPYFKGGPSPYQYTAMFQYYFYSKGLQKIIRSDETGTSVNVYVNAFRFLLEDRKLTAQINGLSPKRIYGVCNQDGEWKGYPVYAINKKYTGYKNYKMILLTKNGQLPWKPVSRRQYLEALRNKWTEERDKTVKALEDGVIKGQKMIDELRAKKMDPATKDRMIAAAQSAYDKQLVMKETSIQKADEMLAKDIARIDEYILKHSATELDEQAIIDEFIGPYGWKDFAAPPYKDAHQLVYIDQSYFDKNLPSYIPQFMTLAWSWNDEVASLYFKRQFEEKFPLEKLQAMIRGDTRKSGASVRLEAEIRAAVEKIVESIPGPNNSSAWTLVRSKITDYLTLKWQAGNLFGTTTAEAFYVKADQTTMTQTDINNGKLVVEVGIAPVKPAEFVIFRIRKQL